MCRIHFLKHCNRNSKNWLPYDIQTIRLTFITTLQVSLEVSEKKNGHYDLVDGCEQLNYATCCIGDWTSQNLTVPDADTSNRTLQDDYRGHFQFDGNGSFTLNIKSVATQKEDINYIEGYMRLKDAEKSDYGALLLAEGLHFLNNGTLYLMGVPDGVRLPLEDLIQMLPNNQSATDGITVFVEQLDKSIEELEKMAYWGERQIFPESNEQPLSVAFNCSFQMVMQLHPVPPHIKMAQLLEYEKQLENPQGISTIHPPPLHLSSLLYSPNCGLSLSISKSSGIKIEKYYSKAIAYAGMAIALALTQIILLIHQMEYTPTPSSVSNISYWTIAIQAMMDGYLCLLHLTTGIVIENVFIPFASAAFFSFILVSVFGMRYLLVIWRIQRPEALRASQTQPTADTANDRPAATEPDEQTLLPIANRPAPTPAPMNPQREATYLYYRLYAVALSGLFLFYQLATRSAFVQNVMISILGFAFFSFWVPQIVRSVSRGCRRPLSKRYIVGMSITRLAIPVYFHACPYNLIAHEPTPWIWALVAYVGLQVLVLLLQDTLGPRFFVPERYLPQTYNYHPLLNPDDEEALQNEETDRNKSALRTRDCAICMLPVNISNTGSTGLRVLGRTQYMVTPCHHLFHTECLEQWMRIKLECPVCRAYLPAC
ncbi:uncharacterized protein BYT42DRAFT_576128 [Radiomyces spectabilis]|uniref:uncharacterized protein n=1 Tax=Radiomyces spectabilis TaxID=64574 RepID=UPI0022207414|nr:uncharacterized protein BYT42DRAFT_576128 [Radiomyces spectabilis]KAI8374372.1 hypothetical protein BYT42DRAFT_576128 [Radiomyces spectabilis]